MSHQQTDRLSVWGLRVRGFGAKGVEFLRPSTSYIQGHAEAPGDK